MTSSIRFGSAGDIYLGGRVATAIEARGPAFIFSQIAGLLRGYDLTFANLESPLTRAALIEKSGPGWRADPRVAVVLADAGLQILNLSNNHIGDCGNIGITDTIATLAAAGLAGFGVGRSLREARTPLVVERENLRVGFLGYCDSYIARGNAYGGAPIQENIIREDVRNLCKRVHCVVVSLHHGIEYSDYPERRVIELTRALVDSGAHLVLGHHPHVLQGYEEYRGGVIVHSLGNFVADFGDPEVKREAMARSILVQRGLLTSHPADTRTEESVVFSCEITADGIRSPAFIPIVINDAFQPIEATGPRATKISERLSQISTGLAEPDLPVYADLEAVGAAVAIQRAKPSLELLSRLHRLRPRHAGVLLRYARSLLRRCSA